MTGRLDKLYKVQVAHGKKQNISFFKKKSSVDKFVSGARVLAKQSNLKNVSIRVRKPLRR